MYHELCLYDNEYLNTDEAVKEVYKGIAYGVSGLNVSLYTLRSIASFVPRDHFVLSTPIDYPSCNSDLKVREHECITAIKSGANTIDLTPCMYLIKQQRLIEFANDLATHKRICGNDVELRLLLGYEKLEVKEAVAVCNIAKKEGIETIIPSIGYHNDDVGDNLLMSRVISDKTGLKVVTNGRVWLKEQYERVQKSKIYGLRVYSNNVLKLLV